MLVDVDVNLSYVHKIGRKRNKNYFIMCRNHMEALRFFHISFHVNNVNEFYVKFSNENRKKKSGLSKS